MKLVKSLALASAAAFATLSGAQAADLPGAEPVEYVKVCDTYGNGFFYIPGSDTCLQIGGFARLELTSGERIRHDEQDNRTGFRSRARLWFDARTETEYGTLRTFIRLQFQKESGSPGQNGQTTGLDGDDFLYDQAYVQFAGLTAGVTDSFWDFKPYPTFMNPFVSDRTLPVIAYTASFGDFSASVALEDRTYRYANAGNATPNAGQTLPDVVANLRVKQGWGEAQLSGVLRRINPNRAFANGTAFYPGGGGDNAWGWGVQGGVKVNLAWAKGDYIWGSAAYTDGAGLNYNGVYENNNGSGRTQSVAGFNPGFDYVAIGGETFKTRAFNANLGILHYWSPKWRSALQGSYIDVNYRRVDADWKTGSITGNLIWSPVKKLDIGAELVYIKNMKKANVGYTGPRKDDDAWVGRLRVQRDF